VNYGKRQQPSSPWNITNGEENYGIRKQPSIQENINYNGYRHRESSSAPKNNNSPQEKIIALQPNIPEVDTNQGSLQNMDVPQPFYFPVNMLRQQPNIQKRVENNQGHFLNSSIDSNNGLQEKIIDFQPNIQENFNNNQAPQMINGLPNIKMDTETYGPNNSQNHPSILHDFKEDDEMDYIIGVVPIKPTEKINNAIESLIYCALRKKGVFVDKSGSLFLITQIQLYWLICQIVYSKESSTKNLGARVRSFERWFIEVPTLKEMEGNNTLLKVKDDKENQVKEMIDKFKGVLYRMYAESLVK